MTKTCEGNKNQPKSAPPIPERWAIHVSNLGPSAYPSLILGLCSAIEGCNTLSTTNDPKSFANCLQGGGKHGRVTSVEETRYNTEIVQAKVKIIGGATLKIYGTPDDFRYLLTAKDEAQKEFRRRSLRSVPALGGFDAALPA